MREENTRRVRLIGEKRVKTYADKIKGVLEEGDVVHKPVAHNLQTSHGDKLFIAVVMRKMPGNKYEINTHAGRLDKYYHRNQLYYQPKVSESFVHIDPSVKYLPPLSEEAALNLINPSRKSGISCRCKNVSVTHLCDLGSMQCSNSLKLALCC